MVNLGVFGICSLKCKASCLVFVRCEFLWYSSCFACVAKLAHRFELSFQLTAVFDTLGSGKPSHASSVSAVFCASHSSKARLWKINNTKCYLC
ncbi:hypothetical protein B9Q02_04365 [Candidatus Marsarchaeota G1 archaeon BE_D]|uniref:Uncharacterized protein n=2 Tax=Candidatus Marsarchaeota TaxID=1978152 RepID=A0A2R6BYP1_9ARCH|nr:MAG: hypothetical protein B9Q02_04365 [Candidatus Marsarchaeota G1 archaeon BE_D]PSO03768.1 MAG: hypothetical protein B9Q12_03780 [Candidatus Marsarchaeota G2 archaeon ECH_B_SAG-G06]